MASISAKETYLRSKDFNLEQKPQSWRGGGVGAHISDVEMSRLWGTLGCEMEEPVPVHAEDLHNDDVGETGSLMGNRERILRSWL